MDTDAHKPPPTYPPPKRPSSPTIQRAPVSDFLGPHQQEHKIDHPNEVLGLDAVKDVQVALDQVTTRTADALRQRAPDDKKPVGEDLVRHNAADIEQARKRVNVLRAAVAACDEAIAETERRLVTAGASPEGGLESLPAAPILQRPPVTIHTPGRKSTAPASHPENAVPNVIARSVDGSRGPDAQVIADEFTEKRPKDHERHAPEAKPPSTAVKDVESKAEDGSRGPIAQMVAADHAAMEGESDNPHDYETADGNIPRTVADVQPPDPDGPGPEPIEDGPGGRIRTGPEDETEDGSEGGVPSDGGEELEDGADGRKRKRRRGAP